MRGKLDLGNHKLAHVYRGPARKERHRRYRPQHLKDGEVYPQLVRLVDGAVRDAFANHPEYLTQIGQRSARHSVVKRVAGALWGYAGEVSFAAQAARGRSEVLADAPVGSAATSEGALVRNASSTGAAFYWRRLVVRLNRAALGGRCEVASADKFWRWPR